MSKTKQPVEIVKITLKDEERVKKIPLQEKKGEKSEQSKKVEEKVLTHKVKNKKARKMIADLNRSSRIYFNDELVLDGGVSINYQEYNYSSYEENKENVDALINKTMSFKQFLEKNPEEYKKIVGEKYTSAEEITDETERLLRNSLYLNFKPVDFIKEMLENNGLEDKEILEYFIKEAHQSGFMMCSNVIVGSLVAYEEGATSYSSVSSAAYRFEIRKGEIFVEENYYVSQTSQTKNKELDKLESPFDVKVFSCISRPENKPLQWEVEDYTVKIYDKRVKSNALKFIDQVSGGRADIFHEYAKKNSLSRVELDKLSSEEKIIFNTLNNPLNVNNFKSETRGSFNYALQSTDVPANVSRIFDNLDKSVIPKNITDHMDKLPTAFEADLKAVGLEDPMDMMTVSVDDAKHLQQWSLTLNKLMMDFFLNENLEFKSFVKGSADPNIFKVAQEKLGVGIEDSFLFAYKSILLQVLSDKCKNTEHKELAGNIPFWLKRPEAVGPVARARVKLCQKAIPALVGKINKFSGNEALKKAAESLNDEFNTYYSALTDSDSMRENFQETGIKNSQGLVTRDKETISNAVKAKASPEVLQGIWNRLQVLTQFSNTLGSIYYNIAQLKQKLGGVPGEHSEELQGKLDGNIQKTIKELKDLIPGIKNHASLKDFSKNSSDAEKGIQSIRAARQNVLEKHVATKQFLILNNAMGHIVKLLQKAKGEEIALVTKDSVKVENQEGKKIENNASNVDKLLTECQKLQAAMSKVDSTSINKITMDQYIKDFKEIKVLSGEAQSKLNIFQKISRFIKDVLNHITGEKSYGDSASYKESVAEKAKVNINALSRHGFFSAPGPAKDDEVEEKEQVQNNFGNR